MAKRRRSAYQTALDLLSRRDHFRFEMVEKLRKKGFSPADIEDAVARCAELGLLDDESVAKRFVELRAEYRGWGPHRLAAELRRRGMAAEDADRASRLSGELSERSLRAALRKIELRAPAGWWRDGQRRARVVSSLITRGFDAEIAIAAVKEVAASREIHDDALDDQ